MVEQSRNPLEYSRLIVIGGSAAEACIRHNGFFEPCLDLVVVHGRVKIRQEASGNQLLESTECCLRTGPFDLVD
jgi:hypothetical protein